MKKIGKISAITATVASSGMAMAQTAAANPLQGILDAFGGNIAGIGIGGLLVVGLVIWLFFRFFRGGD